MAEAEDAELERLAAEIEEARRTAEEHGTLPDGEPEPTLIDPDGDGDENGYRVPPGF